MEQNDLQRAVMAILFAAGESVPTARIAQALEVDENEIHEACRYLMDQLSFARSGIRILKLADAYQMCSSSEMADFVTRALETRKPPKLSASQLEALTVIAYYQPTTKAVVEQIRGVDSSYSVSALQNKHLIEDCGRLNVPGRPILYRTTPDFLRTFGLSDLSELPEIELVSLKVDPEQLEMNTETAEKTDEAQSEENDAPQQEQLELPAQEQPELPPQEQQEQPELPPENTEGADENG